jgi:hypothetical protein
MGAAAWEVAEAAHVQWTVASAVDSCVTLFCFISERKLTIPARSCIVYHRVLFSSHRIDSSCRSLDSILQDWFGRYLCFSLCPSRIFLFWKFVKVG